MSIYIRFIKRSLMSTVRKLFILSIASATTLLNVSQASDTSLEEAKYSLYSNYSSGDQFKIGAEEISVLDLSAWSDTGGSWDNYLRSSNTPSWWNCVSTCVKGYGQENGDYSWGGDSHSIDNFSDKGKHDFDMYLFSFDTEVILTGAGYTWKEGSNNNKEVTVAGISDISMFSNSVNKTWRDVAAVNNVISAGHFGISSVSGGLYESSFTNLTSAKYWLVGAYNTFFDNDVDSFHGVGFKLSSLTVKLKAPETDTAPTQVSEPGALALMGLGLGLVLYRRKRRV